MIAVVVYGLHGSATSVWGMSAKVVESGAFDNFWDALSFTLNGIVFFYAGASSVNFFWRTSDVSACSSFIFPFYLYVPHLLLFPAHLLRVER